MIRNLLIASLLCGICVNANADVWRWIDAKGDTHFVDTKRAIYTWLDDTGKVHYADKPDHENAVSVELVWHSTGTLESVEEVKPKSSGESTGHPGETEGDREEREKAEAYYCKRATEIYDSYLKAPRLYKTDANGEKNFLSDEEAQATLAETKAKVDELCG